MTPALCHQRILPPFLHHPPSPSLPPAHLPPDRARPRRPVYRHRPEGELWLYLRLVLVELREVVARVVAEAMVAMRVAMAAVRVAVGALKAAEMEAEAVRRAKVADKVAAEMVMSVAVVVMAEATAAVETAIAVLEAVMEGVAASPDSETVDIPGIDIDSGIGAPPRKTRAPDRRTVRTNRCTA